MSSPDEDYYRREAADAQRHADRARSESDRAAWLRIAQSWLSLIEATTDAGRFEHRAQVEGTHQDISGRPQ
jgi:hypothetical protein